VKIALAFPDIYEIGMSHLGLKILYEILNALPGVVAERVYTPWVDMERELKQAKMPLFTLESKTPLIEFDIIGFSIQYELSYTNVLNMLHLSGIPLLARDRKDNTYPLIIAGGPCTFNPEPLAEFIDVFCIGEAEELIVELVSEFKYSRDKGEDKKELLLRLAQIQGVYIPCFYDVEYNQDGTLKAFKPNVSGIPEKIKKRIVDIEKVSASIRPVIPFIEIVHDRATIEILRGCSHGCRFCQAGFVYRPYRSRKLETLVSQAQQIIQNTGYEEISLSSLSSSDHPCILELIKILGRYFGRKVAISLPSLRLSSVIPEISAMLANIKKTGLTIAPEAGTKRLAKVINKDIMVEELIFVLKEAYKYGWNTVKLYFMIGLPTETQEDIEGLIALINNISNKQKKQLRISLSFFVPKPHTPFQWEKQDTILHLKEVQQYIKKNIRYRYDKIKFNWHEVETSFLEAIFTRGDRRLSQVLIKAFETGIRFDAWSDYFKFDVWMDIFKSTGISPEFYTNRKRDFSEQLPWEHIDIGVTKEYLIREANRAYQEISTPECSKGKCMECGACAMEKEDIMQQKTNTQKQQGIHITRYIPPGYLRLTSRKIMVRLQYTREKEIIYISHLDIIRMFVRALNRAEIPVAYTTGFSPHPRLSFGHPLNIGVLSKAEFLDIELEKPMALDILIQRLNKVLPTGISIVKAVFIPQKTSALTTVVDFIRYEVNGIPYISQETIDTFMAKDIVWIHRKRQNKEKMINIREFVKTIQLRDTVPENRFNITLEIRTTDTGTCKPEEIIKVLAPEAKITSCVRIAQYCQKGDKILSPIEVIGV
jgi:radical SAM family uncharacterized protein/radical SAM-linked protein